MSDVGVEALLHLGAMSVLVAAGYLGIDRISGQDQNDFESVLTSVKDNVSQWFLQLDIESSITNENGATDIHPLLKDFKAYVLFHIAEKNLSKMAWYLKFGHVLHRQKYAPCLEYFRRKHHLRWISVFGVLSTINFLYLSGSTIWKDFYIFLLMENMKGAHFFLYSFTILLVFFSVAISRFLKNNLPNTVIVLEGHVDTKVRVTVGAMKTRAVDAVENTDLANATGA